MIKRFCILFTAILTGLVFFSVGTLIAAEQVVPDEVTIENTGYKKDKKRPVKLGHKKHSTDKKYGPVKCVDCHHEYTDGKNVWKEGDPVKKCAECHDPKKNTKKDGAKVMKLQNAYHRNCKNCHKKEKKGPFKKCNECHVKK
jgi:hypothetical protein